MISLTQDVYPGAFAGIMVLNLSAICSKLFSANKHIANQRAAK